MAFIPLLTDIPVVLISGLLFSQISNMKILLGAISLFGSVFLLYLGTKSIRTANAEILNLTSRSLRLTYILKNRQKIIACNPS